MSPRTTHIHPVFDRLLQRGDKEALLGQHGLCIWMTGLSGSGKSTIAVELERLLYAAGIHSMVLDGDNVRTGINSNLGFSEVDRTENIRRIAEVAKLFVGNGTVTICCFVSPDHRDPRTGEGDHRCERLRGGVRGHALGRVRTPRCERPLREGTRR
jgi:adenylylsulfate kinase